MTNHIYFSFSLGLSLAWFSLYVPGQSIDPNLYPHSSAVPWFVRARYGHHCGIDCWLGHVLCKYFPNFSALADYYLIPYPYLGTLVCQSEVWPPLWNRLIVCLATKNQNSKKNIKIK